MNAREHGLIRACASALLASACASAPANVAPDAFGLTWKRYPDAHALDNLRIAETLNQEALVGYRGYRSSQLVIVTKASAASVKRAFVERLQHEPGVETASESAVDAGRMFEAIRPVSYLTNDDERARELKEGGVDARQIPLSTLTSKRFNIGIIKQSSSVIKSQIVDATALGAPGGAFVFLQRVDDYEAFTTNWPHVFIPLWHHVSGPLVTTHERSLVTAVLESLGNPPTRMFVSGSNMVNRDLIIEGVQWLSK